MGAALVAIQRDQIDAGFGRVHDLDTPWPDTPWPAELTHRPIVLERLAVVVSGDHPLAERSRLHPGALDLSHGPTTAAQRPPT
jgi:DNA-binding transcriptional LysR family regulator